MRRPKFNIEEIVLLMTGFFVKIFVLIPSKSTNQQCFSFALFAIPLLCSALRHAILRIDFGAKA